MIQAADIEQMSLEERLEVMELLVGLDHAHTRRCPVAALA